MLNIISQQEIPVPTDVWSFTGALLVFVVSVIIVLSGIFGYFLRMVVRSFERALAGHNDEIKSLKTQMRDMSDNMVGHDLGAQKRSVDIKSAIDSNINTTRDLKHYSSGQFEEIKQTLTAR